MRIARWMAPLAAAAAMALAAPAALGQELEVSEEGADPCAAVEVDGHDVSGGCPLHVVGDMKIAVFGVTVTECEHEFDVAVDVDGVGYLYDQAYSGAECVVEACAEGGDVIPAPAEVASTSYLLTTELCVDHESFGQVLCEVGLEMEPIGHSGPVFWAEDTACLNDSFVEVTGEWESEAPGGGYPEIEFDAEWSFAGSGLVPSAPTMNFTDFTIRPMIFRNETNGSLNLTGRSITGPGAPRFTPREGCAAPGLLLRGRTCRVRIQKLTTAGTLTDAYLRINTDLVDSSPLVTMSN